MKKLYRNWLVHNMFAHPVSELVYWTVRPLLGKVSAANFAGWVHDLTIPKHNPEDGRG